jgi:peptidyl-prolyl cis-trans isomerase D
MLSFFRQRGISSVLYGIIIVGTIFTFVIGFRPNAGSKTAPLSETCVARVRGRCIDPKDFGAAYRSLMPSRSAEASRRLNLKKVALDGLVERELLDDEAKRLGISASDDELTDQLFAGFIRVSVPAADPVTAQTILSEMYQSYARAGLVSQEVAQAHFNDRDTAIPVDFRDPKTKAFSMKVYERQVRNISNRSTTEFREGQARELLAAKMRDAIREPIRVSESEAWDTYARQYSTASVTWIPVKESWAARWAVDASAADVADWAKSHADVLAKALEEHQKDDAPKAGHIRHILVSVPAGATDDEKAAALGKLSWAASRIKNGEPFAEVARDMSDDPGSATHGGDVGDKTDGFVGPFKAAADALKPGETTPGAVETQFGYHLITKDDPAKASEIDAAVKRSLPRALVAKERATEAAQHVAKSIADSIRGGKTPDDAVHAAIAAYVHPGGKLDSLKVLPSAEKTVKSDAGAPDASAASAPAAKAPAPQATRFDAATDSSAPTTHTSSAFSRGGDPFPGLSPDGTESVVAFAFAGKAGDVMPAPVRTTDAYVTVVLKDHKESTREDFLKNRDTFAEELERAKRDEAMSLYVKRLRDQAKDSITIDSSYTQEARVDGGASSTDDEDEP